MSSPLSFFFFIKVDPLHVLVFSAHVAVAGFISAFECMPRPGVYCQSVGPSGSNAVCVCVRVCYYIAAAIAFAATIVATAGSHAPLALLKSTAHLSILTPIHRELDKPKPAVVKSLSIETKT